MHSLRCWSTRNPHVRRILRWARAERAAELRRRVVLARLMVAGAIEELERAYWGAYDRAERARLELAITKHQAIGWEIRQW